MTQIFSRALVVVFLLAPAAAAQDKEPAPSKPQIVDVLPALPLRAQIVIARYNGDKRLSSLPYMLSFNGARRSNAQVRMGADIPIATPGDANSSKGISYDHIGTQIDCNVNPGTNGTYVLSLSISEKSVYGDGQAPDVPKSMTPSFRSYLSINTVVLKVGESTQYTAAADRLTGETIRVEVTLQAAK